jgi:gamma-glutamyltranspeptidase/glutathione hydrolase
MTALFPCEKQPATAARGMVVANHPMAAAAGVEMLLAGGNAIDATVATLFALSVVEPMMVGPLGGGLMHIRLADGRHLLRDGLSTAPAAATPDLFEPMGGDLPSSREVKGRLNVVGARAVAVPAALQAWCDALDRFGTMALHDVMAPAIRLARGGFRVSPYLSDCIADMAGDLASDRALSRRFLPDGAPLKPGARLTQPEAAETLAAIAREGAALLHGGALGARVIEALQAEGGVMTLDDLAGVTTLTREPVVGHYRGHTIIGPPPPASAGVHIVQMLNILSHADIGRMGFGSADAAHLIAEAMRLAFADRAVATADPAFVDVPVAHLTSMAHAAAGYARISMDRSTATRPEPLRESADTTHVTIADAHGNVVAATQTLNGLFGACREIPGTGLIANNYMFNFDPRPGRALSIAPGKRVFTSMAPMIALKDGRIAFALGLPGGLRIFPSALQALLNLIDHGMSPQQAVEAPRLWTEGGEVELEPAYPAATAAELERRGHAVKRVNRIAGGMGLIRFEADGLMTGAACWRADGVAVGVSGGDARAGVRFTI